MMGLKSFRPSDLLKCSGRDIYGECSLGSVMAKKIEISASAPDFELPDFSGRLVRLSDYRDQRHVVLVFNRGFF